MAVSLLAGDVITITAIFQSYTTDAIIFDVRLVNSCPGGGLSYVSALRHNVCSLLEVTLCVRCVVGGAIQTRLLQLES